MDLTTFINQLSGCEEDFKKQLKDLLINSKLSSDDFVKKQGEELSSFVELFVSGDITKSQLQSSISDLVAEAQIGVDKDLVAEKAIAQKFISKVEDLVINRLLSLL